VATQNACKRKKLKFEPISKFIIEFFDIKKKIAEKTLKQTGLYLPDEKKETIREEFELVKVLACPSNPGERVKHIKIGDHILIESNFVESVRIPLLNENGDLTDFADIEMVGEAAVVLKVSNENLKQKDLHYEMDVALFPKHLLKRGAE